MPSGSADIMAFRQEILNWYDRHRRVLPWRALPDEQPNPYRVWLSEIMLQQTTVQAVIPYFLKFTEKWPTVEDLAEAESEEIMQDWAGLGYYARARNLYKCAKVVTSEYKGAFPSEQEELRKLPGIGDYTSAAITAIAYGKPANVVDGNVERVMARYFAVTEPLPKSKSVLKSLAGKLSEGIGLRPGDYAQALMDLGATVCTPRNPLCALCPVNQGCEGKRAGIAETLPKKVKKQKKPQKFGHVYWIENESSKILVHLRPEKGLLGGMLGLPTSDWQEDIEETEGFWSGRQQATGEKILHSFTHFDLTLSLMRVDFNSSETVPDRHFWIERKKLEETRLATVFEKAKRLFL